MRRFCWVLAFLLTTYSLQLTAFSQEEVGMKKVVMIIAHEDFRDEELLEPKKILEQNAVKVTIASSSLAEASGMLGARVKPDILIGDINVGDFDAIIFVGGGGAEEYWNDPVAQRIAQDAINQNRIVAAICIAPVTLAKAGVLKGKRSTVWPQEAGQLRAGGAVYTDEPVERDGNIITASGPSAAKEFGEEILKALK